MPFPGEDDQHTPLDIDDELKDSYLTYAMSVIVSRALPDVRDGLKPSQRRILVAMNDLGLGPTSATSKCAGIIGETMKRYHPHGDAAIYATLVRMAQDWDMRHRLIHGAGELRLHRRPAARRPPVHRGHALARSPPRCSTTSTRDTVDFIDNYDGKYREPLVLPSKFPNLLVNGSDGIAVGMATDIPPHNLGEVCNGLITLIDEPGRHPRRAARDHPRPGLPDRRHHLGRQGILDGYRTGRGKVTLRARADIVEEGKRRRRSSSREVPYPADAQSRCTKQIGELVKDERIKGISDIRDESSARNGEPVRLVVDLKRDADPHLVLNQLYQFSPLQKTVSIILLALVDGRPQYADAQGDDARSSCATACR